MSLSPSIGLRADQLTSGTYSLDQLEALADRVDGRGLTLDVVTGNVLICGRRPGWTRRARERRAASDLALLNVLRGDRTVMECKPARQLVDQVSRRVLNLGRPLQARELRDMIRELRSLRRSLEFGRDMLRLRAAEAALRTPSPTAPGAKTLLDAVRAVVRRTPPEALLEALHAASRELSAVDVPAAVKTVRGALGGPEPDFAARLAQRLADPDLEDFLAQLRWLSRSDRDRELHPGVNEAATTMLTLVAVLGRDMAGTPPPPAVPVDREWRDPPLREPCAALCGLPAFYHTAEADEALKERVRLNLLPGEPYDSTRAGDAPYQLGRYFEQDIVREINLLTAMVPDEKGGRRIVDFADMLRLQSAGIADARKFALEAARRLCGADRRGVYALTSVLNQTLGNSVLQVLFQPGACAGLGLTHLPMAFVQQEARKRLYAERLENGDYLVSMDWQSPLSLAGRWDPRLDAWRENVLCDSTRSRFAMSIRLRLAGTDIARGVCSPRVDALTVGMGFVRIPEP